LPIQESSPLHLIAGLLHLRGTQTDLHLLTIDRLTWRG
jgi:hypothetical protein